MGKLLGAGKRLLTGENLFMTVFTHAGSHGKARVAFAAPYPGNIVPISLAKMGGSLICQKDSFLCAARGVSIGIHFQRRILTGLFGVNLGGIRPLCRRAAEGNVQNAKGAAEKVHVPSAGGGS